MLTKTTETGIQALMYLARLKAVEPIPPKAMAMALGVSPSYLAKIVALLVRADILRAHRGSLGGVTFARDARQITLLDIVQVLQGVVHGRYCDGETKRGAACAFHEAMRELHDATVSILGRWRLSDLVLRPFGRHAKAAAMGGCLMDCLRVAPVTMKPRGGGR